MCKFVDIFITQTGHFGLLYLTNFRPCKIGKSWIASGIRPRNDIKPFRPNALKTYKSLHRDFGIITKNREEGIRTPGGIAPTQPFQDCTLSHSDTSLFNVAFIIIISFLILSQTKNTAIIAAVSFVYFGID